MATHDHDTLIASFLYGYVTLWGGIGLLICVPLFACCRSTVSLPASRFVRDILAS